MKEDSTYPRNESLITLFEQQVELYPEHIALEFKQDQLTYTQLNEQANQVALYLKDKGVVAGDVVGIVLNRGIEIITSILGILKIGATYLPVDPTFPENRKEHMLQDAAAKLVINTDSFTNINTYPVEYQSSSYSSDSVAYIMYTSGSTGHPKGIKITHYGVARLVRNTNYIQITSEDKILQLANYAFDGSTFDIYGALLNGATLVLADSETAKDNEKLSTALEEKQITVFFTTTAMFNTLVDLSLDRLKRVRKILFGGERVSVTHVRKALNALGKNKIIHVYGPTESTTYATYYHVNEIKEGAINIPIGRPISYTQTYILDANRQLCGVEMPGELCIAGDGLAIEYLNNPELTAEKFVEFEGKRIYKTGDMVRLLPEGEIEFLDRIDSQVKIRGFRIELGEIENELIIHPQIKEAYVSVAEDRVGHTFIAAYYVAAESLDKEIIKTQLSRSLPDYMLPSVFIHLESFPLNNSGKINKRELPPPVAASSSERYVAPSGETEEKMALIWQAILGIDKVGANDNFFELGGHSLKATMMVSRINKEFGQQVAAVTDVFNYPTIKALAFVISSGSGISYEDIQPTEVKEHYELTHAQKQLWLVAQMHEESNSYNITGANRLQGILDTNALESAIQILFSRHEALRTQFVQLNGEPKQKVLPSVDFKLQIEEVQDESALYGKIEEINSTSFDLTKAPLINVKLFKRDSQHHVLAFSMHHIIGDGWSMQVISDEIITLYNDITSRSTSSLSLPKLQFKDYVAWENERLANGKLEEMGAFWQHHFGEKIKPINLPIDKIRPQVATYEGVTIAFDVDKTLSAKITALAQKQNVTLNVFFLTAFNIFLSKISGDRDIALRSITTGRNHADLEHIIGYFVRVMGIKNTVKPTESFKRLLAEVKSRYLDVMQHDLYPYEHILDAYRTASNSGENLINVSFAMQNLGSLHQDEGIAMQGLKVENINLDETIAKNDLLLSVFQVEDEISFSFNYNTDLFTEKKIKLFIDWFKNLITEIAHTPEKEINDLRLSTGKETALYDYLNVDAGKYEALYPLTTIQRDLYLDSIFNPDDAAHSLAFYVKFNQKIDVNIYQQAIDTLTKSSPTLQLKLILGENEVYQGVNPDFRIHTKHIDISDENADVDRVASIINKEAKVPYDFKKDDLIRHVLIKQSDNEYYSLLCAHHVVFDGWSIKLFFEKTAQIYAQLLEGKEINLPKEEVFFSYVPQHLSLFDSVETQQYWKQKLADVEPLHFDGVKDKKGELISKSHLIPQQQLAGIEAYCKEHKLSPSLYFKSLFAYLIKHYCRAEQDFTIRELLGGRSLEHLNGMGCFYHSIPVCFTNDIFDANTSVHDYLHYVKNQKKELGDYQNISFLLQNKVIGEEEIVFYYNYQTYFQLDILGENTPLRSINTYSENQIQLLVRETAEGLKLILDYDSGYFSDYRFIERLLQVSDQITSGTEVLGKIELLQKEEEKEILVSRELATYDEKATIQALFEKMASEHASREAVTFNDETLTYAQLNERANQLANHILSKTDIQSDDLIGIYADRSLEMMVSILAVLKTGAAYVPIDPDYPADRVQYMIEDSRIKLLVKYASSDIEASADVQIVDLKKENTVIEHQSAQDPENKNNSSDIAYIIYTSGSTGKPKGTMVEHRNVVQLLFNSDFPFDFNENDVWTMFHSFCFDFSVWEMYGALLRGGKVVIVPKEVAGNPVSFLSLLEEQKVTVLNQIPSIFNHLVEEALKKEQKNLTLKYVIFGGEALKPMLLKDWSQAYPTTKLINMYGITETTVHVTYKEITSKEINSGKSNIGKPLSTLDCLMLDADLKLVPKGIAGEICVVGAGVSRGYLYKDELTAQRFIDHPYHSWQRLYRSGDLGRVLENGDIEYLGRIDHQVKVRGHRIELGEIEDKLQQHEDVKECLVVVKQLLGTENDLIAYIKTDAEMERSEIRTHLKTSLPEYMVPTYVVMLAEFPVTPSGKIDRKALPDPLNEQLSNKRFVAPSSELEHNLAQIWSDVLGVTQVGIHDNFFEIGGHSLKATQVINKMFKFLHVELSIRELFTNPTIAQLVQLIAVKESTDFLKIESIASAPHYDLSHAQWRLWLLNNISENAFVYNIPLVKRIEGELDTAKLKNAIQKVVDRHESLRTTFIKEGWEPKQIVHDQVDWQFVFTDLSADVQRDEKQKEIEVVEFKHNFDLEKGPLFRVNLIKRSDNEHIIIFNIHHIISDGWSVRVLMQEAAHFYAGGDDLEDLQVHYKDFAAWHNQLLKGEKGSQLQAYWSKKLSGEIVPLQLSSDMERPEILSQEGESVHFELNSDITVQLLAYCTTKEVSAFTFLTTIVKVLLQRYTNQEDIIVGTPTAGRVHEDLQHQIGFYVNSLVLRDHISNQHTFEEVLKKVSTTIYEAFEHEMYPYDKLMEDLQVERSGNRNPLFDVMVTTHTGEGIVTEKEDHQLYFSNVESTYEYAKFDLTFFFNIADTIVSTIQFEKSLYHTDTIQKMGERLELVIIQILQNPKIKISEIELSAEEANVSDHEMDLSIDFNF